MNEERRFYGPEPAPSSYTTVPEEAFGWWSPARKAEYWRPETCERRGYRPILRPTRVPTRPTRGASGKQRTERKTCRDHTLCLPHSRVYRKGFWHYNRSPEVVCVLCGMRWGVLV